VLEAALRRSFRTFFPRAQNLFRYVQESSLLYIAKSAEKALARPLVMHATLVQNPHQTLSACAPSLQSPHRNSWSNSETSVHASRLEGRRHFHRHLREDRRYRRLGTSDISHRVLVRKDRKWEVYWIHFGADRVRLHSIASVELDTIRVGPLGGARRVLAAEMEARNTVQTVSDSAHSMVHLVTAVDQYKARKAQTVAQHNTGALEAVHRDK
jgi:hypothetical protein